MTPAQWGQRLSRPEDKAAEVVRLNLLDSRDIRAVLGINDERDARDIIEERLAGEKSGPSPALISSALATIPDVEDLSEAILTHDRYPWAISAMHGLTGSTGVIVDTSNAWLGADSARRQMLAHALCQLDMQITGLDSMLVVFPIGAKWSSLEVLRDSSPSVDLHRVKALRASLIGSPWGGPAVFPERKRKGKRSASDLEAHLLEWWNSVRLERSRLGRLERQLISELDSSMGDVSWVSSNSLSAKWMLPPDVQALDLEALEQDHPGLIKAYQTTAKSARVLKLSVGGRR